MKAVNFATLVSMPTGTVFTKYPLGLHELLIKGDTEEGSFSVQHFSDAGGDGGELFDQDIAITGESFPMDSDNLWIDPCVGIHDMFIVYSVNDVENIIRRLQKAVKDSINWVQAQKETSPPVYPVHPKNLMIIEAAKAVNGLVFDDHKTGGGKAKLWGVATLDKGDRQQVVALMDSLYFSVNSVYLDQGQAHLSTSSVGGVIELRGAPVEDGVAKYNEEQKSFPFTCGTLNNVVKF